MFTVDVKQHNSNNNKIFQRYALDKNVTDGHMDRGTQRGLYDQVWLVGLVVLGLTAL